MSEQPQLPPTWDTETLQVLAPDTPKECVELSRDPPSAVHAAFAAPTNVIDHTSTIVVTITGLL